MRSWVLVASSALFVAGGGLFVISHVNLVGVLLQLITGVWGG